MDYQVTSYLHALGELNLKNCKYVSPSAAGLLLQAVSGSHVLTSISIEKVELSTLTPALFTCDLPCLTDFVLEGCVLSDTQVENFMQFRKKGYFAALKFFLLNGTKGMSGWFSHKGGEDSGSTQALDKGGFTLACKGLWVLAVRECGLTKPDIEGLYQAAQEGTLQGLRQLAVSKEELYGVDLEGICTHANTSLID